MHTYILLPYITLRSVYGSITLHMPSSSLVKIYIDTYIHHPQDEDMLWMMMDGWKSMLGWYHHDDTPHPTWRVLSYGWYPRDTLLLFLRVHTTIQSIIALRMLSTRYYQ